MGGADGESDDIADEVIEVDGKLCRELSRDVKSG
jgi:hypothetical protein